MATAICSDYTPVRTRRGKTVHALAMTALAPVCGKTRPRQGWVVASAAREQLNCPGCICRMARLIRAHRRRQPRRAHAVAP